MDITGVAITWSVPKRTFRPKLVFALAGFGWILWCTVCIRIRSSWISLGFAVIFGVHVYIAHLALLYLVVRAGVTGRGVWLCVCGPASSAYTGSPLLKPPGMQTAEEEEEEEFLPPRIYDLPSTSRLLTRSQYQTPLTY